MRRKIRVSVLEMKMMTWHPSIGQLVSARIVTRGLFWLANFKRWGLPHGSI